MQPDQANLITRTRHLYIADPIEFSRIVTNSALLALGICSLAITLLLANIQAPAAHLAVLVSGLISAILFATNLINLLAGIRHSNQTHRQHPPATTA